MDQKKRWKTRFWNCPLTLIATYPVCHCITKSNYTDEGIGSENIEDETKDDSESVWETLIQQTTTGHLIIELGEHLEKILLILPDTGSRVACIDGSGISAEKKQAARLAVNELPSRDSQMLRRLQTYQKQQRLTQIIASFRT